jgi:hypothetical protein
MPSRAREYIVVVRRHCGKFLAGPSVSALGLIGAFAAWLAGADPSVVKWIAWISAAAFVLSIIPAQFGAWKEERELRDKEVEEERRLRELEEAKNQQPEIRGEAFNFMASGKASGHTQGAWSCSANVAFEMEVCNFRQADTNLRGIELDGSEMEHPATFTHVVACQVVPGEDIEHRPHEVRAPILSPGVCVSLRCAAYMDSSGLREWPEDDKLNMEKLNIHLINGFGNRHPINIRAREVLT